MYEQAETQASDATLLPFLLAKDEAESDRLLAGLISDHTQPIIEGVIRRKLHVSSIMGEHLHQHREAEDLYGEAIVRVLARLSDFKANPKANSIGDFRSYVAVLAYNTCHQYFRRKYPQRWRLKNRLRYLLTHDEKFSLWPAEGQDWIAGLAAWQNRSERCAHVEQLEELLNYPQALEQAGLATGNLQSASLFDLLSAIFRQVNVPIEMDQLVNTVARLQGIKDQSLSVEINEEKAIDTALEQQDTARVNVATELERRLYLQNLWVEILQLPLRQRTALLFNLRSGQEGVIGLLPLTGIATIRQIAKAVEMPAEKFAELWNDLPLDDEAVANHLGVTRQQVINLRKSARARLSRRMKLF